ncbi:uncharacterized protein LOC118433811 [Folsomia candida]|uniref:uncharacterized protein LOC118433811 n=1 Tax=Folsomia candida TaxID=158441 RepID=UPI0016052BCC|nr:uncharacterized protein LOC118433811 [Folsomia candida]
MSSSTGNPVFVNLLLLLFLITEGFSQPTATQFPSNEDNYILKDKNGVACIMIHSAFEIQYNPPGVNIMTFPLPVGHVTVTGDCDGGKLHLSWNASHIQNKNWIEFSFRKNESHYSLQNFTGIIYTPQDFISFVALQPMASMVTPLLQYSYKCEELYLTASNYTGLATHSFLMEAFRKTKPGDANFGKVIDCYDPQTPVPQRHVKSAWENFIRNAMIIFGIFVVFSFFHLLFYMSNPRYNARVRSMFGKYC